MPLLTDLSELKSILGIDPRSTSQDLNLNFYIGYASAWIAELLNRPGLFYKERTEYYRGTGTTKLLLRSRPVYTTPTIQVWVDEGGFYGSVSGAFASNTALTYGDDFALQIDQEDGTSRSGILIRRNSWWPKQSYRQRGYLSPYVGPDTGSIKITYTGGYLVDNLPEQLRLACNMLAARISYIMPLGVELNSESYEERSISVVTSEKEKLLALVRPLILSYRNWNFG